MLYLRHLILEMHRRSLWQVLGIYLAAAWGVLQFVEFLTRVAGLPEWVTPAALVLCAVGLPIVAATAFVQEGHPLRRTVPDANPLPGVDAAGRTAPAAPATAPAAEPAVPSASPAPAPSPAGRGDRLRVRTWLSWRRALVGGALGFTALGAATGGYLGMRVLGIGPAGTLLAAGVLSAADGVVLADFDVTGVEAATGDVITEALRIDLLQSRAFVLVDPADLRHVLVRMQHPAGTRVTAPVAREAAQREGYGLVVAGEVGRLGGGYVLTARLLVPESGATAAAFRHTARDDAGLLAAVDALSRAIRARIGESLRTVHAGEPLERVTTTSLDALLRYTTAERIASGQEPANGRSAFLIMQEAVELDSTFAMAHRKLGAWLLNSMERTPALQHIEAAYRHRERLPELERRLTDALHATYILLDPRRAIDAYQRVLELDPGNKAALNNITGAYFSVGSHEEAVEAGRRGMAQPFPYTSQHFNIVPPLVALGRLDEAEAVVDTLEAMEPRSQRTWQRRVQLAANRGELQRADSMATLVLSWDSVPSFRWYMTVQGRASIRATLGRLDAALADLEWIAEEGRRVPPELAYLVLGTGLREVRLLAEVRGDTAAASARLRALVRQFPVEPMAAMDRPLAHLAHAAAVLGHVADAEQWLADADAQHPTQAVRKELDYELARAELFLRTRRARDAVDVLRLAGAQNGCPRCVAIPLARAFEQLGQPDSAAAQYRSFIETPAAARLDSDAIYLAAAHFRLAELLEERGDATGAVRHYAAFINLWRNADASLQPRVRVAERRLAVLRGRD
jgi:eukaryotic-like serine/threonine-protein kinase